jgi:insertion element IS1 protein InsB
MFARRFRSTVDQKRLPGEVNRKPWSSETGVQGADHRSIRKPVTFTTGKQNHQCKDCERQFVECFEPYRISDGTRRLIERLLVERISLRGICRAVGVGLKRLLGFLVQCVDALPGHLNVEPVTCTRDVLMQPLDVETDEMASFVKKKANKQWMWLAMDVMTRQVIAFYVGDRSRRSAKRLWPKIPVVYRQHAT